MMRKRIKLQVKFNIAYFVPTKNLKYPRFVSWRLTMEFMSVPCISMRMLEKTS